jgi:carbamoyl-phosphate synthase small subunit
LGSKIHHGVIVSEPSPSFHHHAAKTSFLEWLKQEKVPLLAGIDTRALTKLLRTRGVALGAITHEKGSPKKFIDPNATSLVAKVSTKQPREYGQGKKKIIAVDCGMKENIIRSFAFMGN